MDIEMADSSGQLYDNSRRGLCRVHGIPLDDGFCDACHIENNDD